MPREKVWLVGYAPTPNCIFVVSVVHNFNDAGCLVKCAVAEVKVWLPCNVKISVARLRTHADLDDADDDDNDERQHLGDGEDVLDARRPLDAQAVDKRQRH